VIRRVAFLAMHSSPLSQPGVGDAGGMNVYVDELARTMAERGVRTVVFTRRTDPHVPDVVEPSPGYRVVHVAAGPPRPMSVGEMAPLVGWFATQVVGWSERNTEGFDVIHSHYWLSGWLGVLVKEALDVPLANSFHTLGRIKDAAAAGEQSSPAVRIRTEDEVIAAADCVVAATPYEFDDLLEHYGASPARLFVSPPGVDHRTFSPGDRTEARRRLGLGAAPLILFVGRIQPHKGADVAIRSLARLPMAVAAGDGPPQLLVLGGPSGPAGEDEMTHLVRLARSLGVGDRVTFLPPRPHPRLPDFYRAADLLIMPSRSESFGLAAVEAQACGLPVVAARVGGLAYTVADSESGLLVDGRDPGSFAAAMTAILDHPAFTASLSTGAVRYAERFSWEAAADRLLGLYETISR
jgi:D-inositol-3-phosphate glycosyltransferase